MRVLKILLCALLLALPVLAEEAEDRQTATSLHYVSHELDTRQDKLTAGTNAALTYTNTAGGVQQRTVKENLNGGTTDTSLPQVNAVNAGLNTKQDDITTIDDHTAVTYTNSVGTIGQKGIYQDTGTYAEQTDSLIDAKTFNAALKNGLDNEFVCADRPDAHDPNTNLCWLWEIHNETENKSQNLFDISKIPTQGRFVNNGDGSITVSATATSSYCSTGRKLSELAPGIEVGKTYVLSYLYTSGGLHHVFLTDTSNNHLAWRENTSLTITADMLNSIFVFNVGVGDTATFYNVQIEEGTTPTPYMPYNANVYIPQNQQ